ncbi:MAG: hypothetical protein A2293_02155 [Elusimicrobia bacterium RIFOXYB2_FULL_49_7]|nr:MAG: hypothetical protein A2293_02155 [Elusimicrobia bacterium RIFOXYB2_FULL_49_7]
MNKLVRFGVSLESDLLKAFDTVVRQKKYPTRSKAIADLLRKELSERAWDENRKVFGIISLAYDHHKRLLVNQLLHIQHDHHHQILTSQHLHINHHVCLEIIAVCGQGGEIKALFNKLKAQKGVLHAAFTESMTVE